MSKAIAIDEDAVRTRAYLMWEADGRPFGRDTHYWDLALAELSSPAAKPKHAAATSAVAQKKARPAKAAAKSLAAKPAKAKPAAKAKAPTAKGRRK